MWRPFVSLLACVLGAVLLLQNVADMPPPYLPVPLVPRVTAQAPAITIPPGPLATLPPVIEPHWGDAVALAMAHPHPAHKRTLIAHVPSGRAVAVRTPPDISPIGRVIAWLSAHAVRSAFPNDQLQGG